MGCASCGKNRRAKAAAATTGNPKSFVDSAQVMATPPPVPTASLVNKRTRKAIQVETALVDRKPKGGWALNVAIKGVGISIAAQSPSEAISKWRHLSATNGESEIWNEKSAWVEANNQWMDRTSPKYHLVSVQALHEFSDAKIDTVPTAEPEIKGSRKTHDPEVWGSKAWAYLGLVLAKDHYDPAEFIAALKFVVDLLNPNINPSLGCIDCYRDASKKMSMLRAVPPVNISQARIWLWEFHNSVNAKVGKASISYEKAAALNHWN